MIVSECVVYGERKKVGEEEKPKERDGQDGEERKRDRWKEVMKREKRQEDWRGIRVARIERERKVS